MSGTTKSGFKSNQGATLIGPNTAKANPHSALPLQSRVHPHPEKNISTKSPTSGSQTIDSIEAHTQMSARNDRGTNCPAHSNTPPAPKNYIRNPPHLPSQPTEKKQPNFDSNPKTNPERTPFGPRANPERTPFGPRTNPIRTVLALPLTPVPVPQIAKKASPDERKNQIRFEANHASTTTPPGAEAEVVRLTRGHGRIPEFPLSSASCVLPAARTAAPAAPKLQNHSTLTNEDSPRRSRRASDGTERLWSMVCPQWQSGLGQGQGHNFCVIASSKEPTGGDFSCRKRT